LKITGVADTHTALWHVFDDARLSKRAKTFIDEATIAAHKIAVSVISLAEIVYLIEKKRLPEAAYDELRRALADPEDILQEIPLTYDVVEAMRSVPREAIPDMPDRIVAATAIYLRVPVISRDGRIRASTVETVW
jgi:PIN domain nuclease of toxin-antitoxin system